MYNCGYLRTVCGLLLRPAVAKIADAAITAHSCQIIQAAAVEYSTAGASMVSDL